MKPTYEELQAQVEVLQDAAIKICLRLDADGVSTYGIADDVESLQEVVNKTPATCLAQVKAEAGRAGFIAGYHKMHIEFVGSIAPAGSAEHAADQYAERIKQGDKPWNHTQLQQQPEQATTFKHKQAQPAWRERLKTLYTT